MSFVGNRTNGSLNLSASKTTFNKSEQNLLQKIEHLSQVLSEVNSKVLQLSEQCSSIKQDKQSVHKYLQTKSQQNRQRLMGELQFFEQQVRKKIETGRKETQKVDERIEKLKNGQLTAMKEILALQRRVHQIEVQVGMESTE